MEAVLLLLVLLALCRAQADYSGTVMTYYPLSTDASGRVTVEVRFKSNSGTCDIKDYHCPTEGCYGLSHVTVKIDAESSGEFCQVESIWTRQGPINAPILMRLYLPYSWISPTVNGITIANAMALLEIRQRSDTGQTNRSPQTTILPIIRVPYNCQRDIRLLAFDPDGDQVKCRFANNSIDPNECTQCTPASVLNLSPSCSLSFSPNDNTSVGRYAVQMMIEDFAKTNIILSLINGSQEQRTTNDSVSRIPVQFVFSVEAAAPSCSEGLYLPRFVEPTPEHGAQLNVNVSQTLQITIKAEANVSTVSELLFSGPSRINETNSGGQFILSWSPVQTEDGQSHPVCFSVQALLNTTKYTSEFRCVIVNVGNVTIEAPFSNTTDLPTTTAAPPTTDTAKVTTAPSTTMTAPPTGNSSTVKVTTAPSTTMTAPPTGNSSTVKVFFKARITSSTLLTQEDIRTTVIPQFRDDLVKHGLPTDIILSLLNSTTATPAGAP